MPVRTEAVFLSFISGSGLVALKGELTRDGGGVRFQVRDGVRVRRRRASRVEVRLPVTLAHVDGETVAGTTVNVSPDGVLVRCPLKVELRDRIDVELTLPTRALRLRATVVRHSDGMAALQFDERAGGGQRAGRVRRRAPPQRPDGLTRLGRSTFGG